jgi:hypothetical protein
MNRIVGCVISTVLMMSGVGSLTAGVIDFESVPLGASTPFEVRGGAVTAYFSSRDESGFSISPSFTTTLTGNILMDDDAPSHDLDILFSSPLTSISLLFALNDPTTTSTLKLTAFSGGVGGVLIGSISAHGSLIDPFAIFPEGTISFQGRSFDTVSISSTAPDFAIDSLSLQPVPEPSFIILTAVVLISLLWVRSLADRIANARSSVLRREG